ncbi:MAG TPA: hypothetical protein VJY84_02665 [Candidatus Saccharimonadales bacterium]|nr:hypothetical protein [Candidatus Saccharimonadales bacterium]
MPKRKARKNPPDPMTQRAPQPVQHYLISAEALQAILDYLGQRPYFEVINLIDGIQKAEPFTKGRR